jgi:hypothetical protein
LFTQRFAQVIIIVDEQDFSELRHESLLSGCAY